LLTKALSKANKEKGAPKIVNLAEEHVVEAKNAKLRKFPLHSHPVRPCDTSEVLPTSSDPEIFNQLSLLDHLLRLPVEQLQTSSQRAISGTVTHADLNQHIVQPQRKGATGVSLFSSAAAVGDQLASSCSLHEQTDSLDGPKRHVHFASADARFASARATPGPEASTVEEAHRSHVPKSLPSTVSPRTRAIKNSSSAANDTFGATPHVPSLAGGDASYESRTSREASDKTKAVYGSVRFGAKGKLLPRITQTLEDKNRS
jgi:hypothetical protein